ncbi:B-cell receptor CD22-like isoform X3 [Sparus aurata]|nr:B-cell receptor CD22-like isoform X3 [Sparus aurata]
MVEETFWFTTLQGNMPVDLRTHSGYAGRVEYSCSEKSCTLRITDLRESDSAEYKFRFITDQEGGRYIGSPGVTLRVTGFQVQRGNSKSRKTQLNCHSSCRLPRQTSYIWYENGRRIWSKRSSYLDTFYSTYSYSCAVEGHEDVLAPPVCGHGYSCTGVKYTNRSICAFKGSSVDISCIYRNYQTIRSKFWFSPERFHQWQSPSQPEDLSEDSQFAGRVQVLESERGRSTLRITDLTESDSAQYHFKFTTTRSDWRSSLPGTTLTVTAPDLKVQVILSPAGPQLICYSSCLTDRSPFIWYQNDKKVEKETSPSYAGYVDPADSYSCGYEGHRSVPVYAPKLPSVLISPTGDIMRGSSVTLTCSSDANPAAKYTWYKKNGDPDLHPLSKEPQLVFSSIQSSDSGEYYCTADNKLARTSKSVIVDVKYAPRLPSVSVSPSAEIVEGSSVTLTCSSDANPAANYTWYKEKQELLRGQTGIYHFSSISSEDRGNYSCKSENQYGEINSSFVSIDVQYAPRLPSVSVSPSAEIVEGSSVNLTCSSDANPAANYTWYKENEDSPKASGQIFTITDFRAEHSGNYYCEAQNRRGRHNSTLQLIVVAGAGKSAAIGTITVILLLIVPIAVYIWNRRKTSLTQQSSGGKRPDNGGQVNLSDVYGNVSGDAQRQPAEQEDELHYTSIRLSVNQEEALYCNFRPAQLRQTEEEEEEDGVDYTIVKTD